MTSQGLGRRRAPLLALVPWAHQFGLGALGQDAGKTMANELYHGGWPAAPVEIPVTWLRPAAVYRQDPPIARAEVTQEGGQTARSYNADSTVNGREWLFTETIDSLVDVDPANFAAWITAYYTDPLPRAAGFTLILNNRSETEIWRILGVVQGTRISLTGTPADDLTVVSDAFGRSVSSGLGSADTGQTWTTSGGSAADYGVSGTRATMAITSTGVARTASIGNAGADIDVTVYLVPTIVAGGAQIEQKIRIRHNGTNFYETNVQYQTSGVVDLYLVRDVTALSAIGSAISYTSATTLGVRMQAYGSTIRHKIWDAAGAEPAAWTATVTDTTYPGNATDSLMLVADRVTGNTDSGLVLQWDNLLVTTPNPKAWPAGATELVVEGITHQIGADLRSVTWQCAPIIGAAAGTAGPWFYSDSSRTSGSDVVPF